MSKILVTGVNGFVGKHLTRELTERDCEVVGVGRDARPDSRIANQLSEYYSCDLTNPEEVGSIELAGIDAVISLAGLARVGDSFKNPDFYMKVNVEVLSVIGQRMLDEQVQARLVAISTGAVYDSNQSMPLTEDSRVNHNASPYVQSKLEMEKAANSLREGGVDCVVVRPFNHTGPEQEKGFLLPDLYSKVVDAENTKAPVMVGNLETKRDYTDVRDVVRAYADLALEPTLNHNLYNVCSSRSISGRDILSWLQKAMGVNLETKLDESLLRPNDPEEIFGNYDRLRQDTGWKPLIPIDKTVEDFVNENDESSLLAA